jgi:hypothetical protein
MTSYSSTEIRLENDVTRGAVVFPNAFSEFHDAAESTESVPRILKPYVWYLHNVQLMAESTDLWGDSDE